MTSDREKCGFTSLLPMSCRGRAEAFAQRLHTRLSSLGSNHHHHHHHNSHHNDDVANETSWLGNHESSIAISQPLRHSSDSSTDKYFDFGETESPNSPDTELDRNELEHLLNKDNLKSLHNDDCHCSIGKDKIKSLANGYKATTSNDSDSSEGIVFYDTTDDLLDVQKLYKVDKCDNGDIDKKYECSATSSTDNNTVPPTDETISEDFSSLTISDSPTFESSSPKTNGSLTNLIIVNGDEVTQTENDIECGKNDIDEVVDNSSSESNGKLPKTEDCTETYISSLSINKDLILECPNSSIKTESLQTQQELKQNEKEEEEEEEEDYDRIPRVRRCSSLKTGKTPPGTPSRKKIVRFADALGLDLADVRTFLDDIPKIPTSAYDDLKDADLNDETDSPVKVAAAAATLEAHLKFHGIKTEKVLVPLFQQPGSLPDFLDKVREKCVCLENAIVDDPIVFCVKGIVRVRNLDFNKSVHIRYTLNQWKSFADVQAVYIDNSCDGFSDKFKFIIYAHTLGVGQRLEFAVRFQCKGCQYWDNNNGINYIFQCLPSTQPSAIYTPITPHDSWGAGFY